MPVEHFVGFKELTKFKVPHSTYTLPDIVGQKIHIDVQISNDAVD
jgi:hypothetical protein